MGRGEELRLQAMGVETEGSGKERAGLGQERWRRATSVLPPILPPVRSCLGAWGCHRGSQSPLPTGGPRSSTWGQRLRLALWAAAACQREEWGHLQARC